jgi:hypothetical protein
MNVKEEIERSTAFGQGPVELSNEEKAVELEKESHASDLKADKVQLQACQADLKAEKRCTLRNVFRMAGITLGVGIRIGLHFVSPAVFSKYQMLLAHLVVW